MYKTRLLSLSIGVLVTYAFLHSVAQAAFPDDFEGVVWRDPAVVATWAETATLSVSHNSSALRIINSKRAVWPKELHSILQSDCCNASAWVFARFNGVWNAATFEYMRFDQIIKGPYTVNGTQVGLAPFKSGSYVWTPNQGEVIAFMVSGMARRNLNDVNVRERSNVYLYKWGVGPVTEIDDDGIIVDPPEPEPEPEPEEVCVEPEPENNTHLYTGTVGGRINIVTPTGLIPFLIDNEPLSITVKDDRSLVMTVDTEQMQAQVQANGNFSGSFTLQEELLGQPCNVTINVQGNVNGKAIIGTGTGSERCGVYSALLEATFSATSQTFPSFLDERPNAPKLCAPVMAPIHSLLLL